MRFLFVDRIISLKPGQSITAEKHIAKNEPYFRDHFPGFPVVPGVLLTEMMAQTAGKCLNALGDDRGKAMLTKIKMATFRSWVQPEQTCIIHAEIRADRPHFATADARIEVKNKKICSADLMFSFLSNEDLDRHYTDPVLEDFLTRHPSL